METLASILADYATVITMTKGDQRTCEFNEMDDLFKRLLQFFHDETKANNKTFAAVQTFLAKSITSFGVVHSQLND